MASALPGLMKPLAVGVLALAAAVAAAACGQASPAAGSGPSAATRAVAYASCMRAHGLGNFPDPSAGSPANGQGPTLGFQINGQSESFNLAGTGIDPSSSQFQSAQQACAAKMGVPGGGPVSGGATSPQMKQAALAFAACMRDHGIPTFPDPTFGAAPKPPKAPGGGGGFGFGIAVKGGGSAFFSVHGVNPQSTQYEAAFKTCQPKLQAGLGTKAGQ